MSLAERFTSSQEEEPDAAAEQEAGEGGGAATPMVVDGAGKEVAAMAEAEAAAEGAGQTAGEGGVAAAAEGGVAAGLRARLLSRLLNELSVSPRAEVGRLGSRSGACYVSSFRAASPHEGLGFTGIGRTLPTPLPRIALPFTSLSARPSNPSLPFAALSITSTAPPP